MGSDVRSSKQYCIFKKNNRTSVFTRVALMTTDLRNHHDGLADLSRVARSAVNSKMLLTVAIHYRFQYDQHSTNERSSRYNNVGNSGVTI